MGLGCVLCFFNKDHTIRVVVCLVFSANRGDVRMHVYNKARECAMCQSLFDDKRVITALILVWTIYLVVSFNFIRSLYRRLL